jgi:transitional endoplasmic reticulum ATPase
MTERMRLSMVLRQDDARGIVHMAAQDMRAAGLSVGATIRIDGARPAFARAAPGPVAAGTMAADRMTARNCGLPEGGEVGVGAAPLGHLDRLLVRLEKAVATSPADLQDALFDMALGDGDRVSVDLPTGRRVDLTVVKTGPTAAGLIGDATRIVIETPAEVIAGFEKIGGMARQVAAVHEMIAAPLLRPELFQRLGIAAPRGVLFTGPPGSGKTLLARAVAQQTRAAFFQIDGPEILSKHYGESEAALRQVFEAATRAQPAIIFIDEIDSLAPRRDGMSAEKQVERRVVAQLLTLMDGMADRGRVLVMAATNLPNSVDPALRRPGRFDREIAFLPPTDAERREILAVHLSDAPLSADVDLDRIAAAARGYVGADLAALARESAMAALARSVRAAGSEALVRAQDLEITQADLETGLAETGPSLLRGAGSTAMPLRWQDIGGLSAVKASLRQAVEWPDLHRDAMAALGLSAPRGILLTGPPGAGKTMMARALAGEAALNFIPVRPPDLVSQFLGEAEKAVMSLFEMARQTAPSLLFFDEFDALAPRRGSAGAVFDRIVAQLLVEIDGITAGRGVTILAATNRAAAIDPALLRPGRIDRVIELPLPDADTRGEILRVHLGRRPCAADVDIASLALRTIGASGADLADLADRAAWTALERAVLAGTPPVIRAQDLDAALDAQAARHRAERSDHISNQEAAT